MLPEKKPTLQEAMRMTASLGGFLGVGTKLIAMPYDAIKVLNNKLTMPGATKDALKALPEFKYKTG